MPKLLASFACQNNRLEPMIVFKNSAQFASFLSIYVKIGLIERFNKGERQYMETKGVTSKEESNVTNTQV